jgi:hypothetical protein
LETGTRSTQLELPLMRDPHDPRSADHTGFSPPDPRIAPLKALLFKHLNPKALTDIQHLLQQHTEERTGDGGCSDPGGVGETLDSRWNWNILLGYSGLQEELRAEILASEALQRNFLGQVFYGYEQRSTGNGRGIKSPFRFAASRCRDSPPPEYLELAAMLPAELAEVLEDETRAGAAAWISEPARRLVGTLRRAEFLSVLQEAGQRTG